MKKQHVAILISVAVVVTVAVVFVSIYIKQTYLDFSIRDQVSKSWIWDATVALQNRTIRSYYQSDRGIREYRFNKLEAGDEILTISAPGYEPESVPVSLRRGANRILEPIELAGTGIPDLQYFLVFETIVGGDIVSELRPVNSEGTAVLNHPCMDLWIGARVSVQMGSDGVATEESKTDAYRGNELFRGQISWKWNADPEAVFRYVAHIPGGEIKDHTAPYLIIDYLILVPTRGTKGGENFTSLIGDDWDNSGLSQMRAVLDTYKDRFTYYIHTSWNLKSPE